MDIADSGALESTSGISHEMSPNADIATVERVKRGDVAAFDILIKKYRERLFCVVYNIVSNREDAMDIVQDAFIKAFSSINSFKGKSAFYTWLYRIAVNMSVSFIKKNRKKRFFSFEKIDEEVAGSEIIEKIAIHKGGSKTAMLNELKEKLNEALANLSIDHRTVVVLHEIEGLSHAEIAEITGTREATVRSRLHYAKQLLQGFLKDYIN